jgi:hypothetical protein
VRPADPPHSVGIGAGPAGRPPAAKGSWASARHGDVPLPARDCRTGRWNAGEERIDISGTPWAVVVYCSDPSQWVDRAPRWTYHATKAEAEAAAAKLDTTVQPSIVDVSRKAEKRPGIDEYLRVGRVLETPTVNSRPWIRCGSAITSVSKNPPASTTTAQPAGNNIFLMHGIYHAIAQNLVANPAFLQWETWERMQVRTEKSFSERRRYPTCPS